MLLPYFASVNRNAVLVWLLQCKSYEMCCLALMQVAVANLPI